LIFFLKVDHLGGSVWVYFKRKFLNFGIILKNGMPADTNALHRPVTEVANLEGPEELVAEDSQNTDFLFGQSPKQTMAAICLLPLTCCATTKCYCATTHFSCLLKENFMIISAQILEITNILT
jgi:hypothetical protein